MTAAVDGPVVGATTTPPAVAANAPAPRRRIAAVGGGGFLLDDASLRQERYLLSLVPTARLPARVLFLGTASGDAERAQLKFMKAFASLGCTAATLPFFPYEMRRDYAAAVREADLVYVGGGNTPAMLAVWREFGFHQALRAAYENGTVLAGISAGANCWFEHYVTDSVPGGGVRDGLGWLPGTFCPHLDSEPWRGPLLAATVGAAVGAGEHVVVLYEDEQRVEAVCSADAAGVTCCARSDGAGPPAALAVRELAPAAPST